MSTLTLCQSTALTAANKKPGYAYFLEMGLGKTLLTLTEFLALVADDRKASRLVVACPNSFKSGWAAEISKHRLHLAAHVYEASKHKAARDFVGSHFRMPPVLIVNYESVRLTKTQQLIETFTAGRPAMLVLDESINLKNPQAKRTKSVHRLTPQFAYVRVLSGKPTTQGPADLWGQLAAIGMLGKEENFYQFRNRYCIMGGWENREVVGVRNEDDLRIRMQPFVFRATKAEFLPDLPPKSYTTREYELKGELLHHYQTMETDFLAWIEDHRTGHDKRVVAAIALTKLGKLQQIMCGFLHDDLGNPQWIVDVENNPRVQVLLELLDEIDTKVCITYRHRFVGEGLKLLLPGAAVLEGGMRPRDIEAAKDDFNIDKSVRHILLQIDAAKYGHTLIGNQFDPCHTMVFFENTFSLDTRSQVEDRIHRIGQHNAALYVDFTGASMDREIVRALQFKQNLFNKIFKDDEWDKDRIAEAAQ